MEVKPSGIAARSTSASFQGHSQAINEASASSVQTSQASNLTSNSSSSTVTREPTSADAYRMAAIQQRYLVNIITEMLDQKELRASTTVKNWLASQFNSAPINIDHLLCVDGELTRYGKINIDGRQFIVGPRPEGEEVTGKQGHIYQRLINAHPNIGAIFGVDKNLADMQSKISNKTPAYKLAKEYVRFTDHDHAAKEPIFVTAATLPATPQSIIYKEFQGFNEKTGTPITPETFWKAGREIAQFMKAHPEQIVMICSEHGISRPCAVAASTVMQLEEHAFAQFKPDSAAWGEKFEALKEELKAQRCFFSDIHIEASKKSFSANLTYVSLLNEVRTAGSWDNQMGDIVPQILPQTSLLDGRGLILQNANGHFMHRYALDENGNANEQHDGHIIPQDGDIILYHLIDDQLGNHYEVGNAQGEAWNGKTVVARDGDCLFRALHRALSIDDNLNEADETAAILNYREVVANYFADNIDTLVQFTTAQKQPVWTSENLGKNIQFENIEYPKKSGYILNISHTDQITLEDIDVTAPTSIRLVMRNPQSNALTTDNKYFHNSSIASYHKDQLHNQGVNQAKSLTSTFPIIGFIDHQDKVQDIELLLGTTDYTIHSLSEDGPQRELTYHLPILSVAHREISLITDEHGRAIGGDDYDGKKVFIDNDTKELATNAVFFRAKLATSNLADKTKMESLVCYTDPDTLTHKMKYVDARTIPATYWSQNDAQYHVVFKNPAQLDTTIQEQYPPLPAEQSWYDAMPDRHIAELLAQRQHIAMQSQALLHGPLFTSPQHSHTTPPITPTTCSVEANVRSTQRRDDPDTDPDMGGAARNIRAVPHLFQKIRAYVKEKVRPQQNQGRHHTNTQHNAASITALTRHNAHQTPTSFIANNMLLHQSREPQSQRAIIDLRKQSESAQNKIRTKQEQRSQIDQLTAATTSAAQSATATSTTDDKKERPIDVLQQKKMDLARKKEILLAEKMKLEAQIVQQAHVAETEKTKPINETEKKILPHKNAAQKTLAN